MNKNKEIKICVVGLGYVGLPLAVKFGQSEFETFGFDLKKEKIKELKNNYDSMHEIEKEELEKTNLEYFSNPEIISKSNFIIIAVPTPINKNKKPDITLLLEASKLVGKYLKKGSTIVYESTVYPGCTEEDCIPIIEKFSNLKNGVDFFVGYSPERINPGDKKHTIDKIVKIVSGQNEKTLNLIEFVYKKIIKAGIHKSKSIKIAEAAKIIENIQRDVNIALINELSIIFDKMNIPTKDILLAAKTKWNFLNFSPGLVGGHCIGIDPYYLIYKSESFGYFPKIISSARSINEEIPLFISNKIIKMLIQNDKKIKNSNLLLLGLTFKENVNDLRNSKAKDIIKELKEYGINIITHEPFLSKKEVKKEFGIENISKQEFEFFKPKFNGIILVTAHDKFKNLNFKDIISLCNENPIFYDIKNMFSKELVEDNGFKYKSL